MKNKIWITICAVLIMGLCSAGTMAQTSPVAAPALLTNYPWMESELVQPSVLAATLKETFANWPVILNIGAVEDIKGAKHIGAVSTDKNMNLLKNTVAALPKSTVIVIYCGCCPFTKCPNIRPAYIELKKLGFTQIKLLDLPVNLQTNWVAKGYPLAEK
ncbi:rhodanese-like domain-containing protein [Mucilaginibacter sp.]|uniref:rhodanese-like domain-containing protein n=1 Tax=Mucilaginibacter sp. TaxID=1882438 RepID=UPI003D108DA8